MGMFSADIASHSGPVWRVAWGHPRFGVILASCGFDKKVVVHMEKAPGTWEDIYTFSEHSSSVNDVSWAPQEHGLVLASASSDGRVVVHTHQPDDSWETTWIEGTNLGCNAVSFAPYAGAGSPMRLVTGGCDSVVRVYSC